MPTCAALLSLECQLQQVVRHTLAIKPAKQQHIGCPWRRAATAAPAAAAAVGWAPAGGWLLRRMLLYRCVARSVGTARHPRVLRQHPAARPPVKN